MSIEELPPYLIPPMLAAYLAAILGRHIGHVVSLGLVHGQGSSSGPTSHTYNALGGKEKISIKVRVVKCTGNIGTLKGN